MKLSVLLIVSILIFGGCSDSDSPTSPEDQNTDPVIAVYDDHGVWSVGVNQLDSIIESLGWTIQHLSADEISAGQLNSDIDAIIFPGGNAGIYVRDLSNNAVSEIQSFVSGGGGYIGICAGGFLATDRIVWYGTEIDYPLNLLPGTSTGPLEEITEPGSFTWTDVNYNSSHPSFANLTGIISSYYYDGPEFNTPGADVFATYSVLNSPAGVTMEYGNGKVAVIGIHPEMSTSTHTVLKSMLGWVTNTSEKSAHVPVIKQQLQIRRKGSGPVQKQIFKDNKLR